jgi:hypothetical protein
VVVVYRVLTGKIDISIGYINQADRFPGILACLGVYKR